MKYQAVIALVGLLGTVGAAALINRGPTQSESYIRVRDSTAAQQSWDLRAAGELRALQSASPERYARVLEFIRAVEQTSCRSEQLQLIETSSKVSGARCMGFIRTSNPPKADVQFSLDGVGYIAAVTLRGDPGQFTPVGGSKSGR